MNGDDQRFENFLRGFEPRRPRPLPLAIGIWRDKRRLVAAAVILVAIGGSLWVGSRSARKNAAEQRPSMTHERADAAIVAPMMSCTVLTRAALEDQRHFDAQMNDIASRSLPRFDRTDSSLRALARE
jgi:hypothetical protein